jgi:S1-C subfamily serine protease
VPADRAFAIAKDIVQSGGKERGFLGVRVVELSDEMRSHVGDPALEGVIVAEVVPASPAESVGIAPGDVITSFAARQIQSVRSLLETVGQTKPGDVVSITYIRNSKRISDDIRVSPFLSEYLHRQAPSPKVSPEDIGARIENIRSEIERLKVDLKDLESRR